jgi:hypothetical protein
MTKFHERFDINIGVIDAQVRFVNRAYNLIFYSFFLDFDGNQRYAIEKEVLTALGDKYHGGRSFSERVGEDFYRNLQAIEAFYNAFSLSEPYAYKYRGDLEALINRLLQESEIDLGIRWEKGRFIKSGAKLLDEKLVNDVLHWLKDKKYESVVKPFDKGLRHYLHSEKRPELMGDVITDMYEALEALAKIVADRPDKDLSANKELFISKVNASEEYKKLLSDYIDYANKFRHAVKEGQQKPKASTKEAESFIYLTGIFIRLAIS